ncbi:MAG: hypothetical protein KAH56_02305 [Candidatus Krumholzibacteria bacterium]|nr:hypothetical protein [Candidatus Krumholzibacteria bacterium]
MEPNPSQNEKRDSQLNRLAGQMRDAGTVPGRDLWPDIDAAIDQAEHRTAIRAPRRKGRPWLRLAGVAAVLTLMLAAGWVGVRSITGDVITGDVASLNTGEAPETEANGLAVIDKALDELLLALKDDPENRNLSHLVLMVHKTRGHLLRRNSESLVRN